MPRSTDQSVLRTWSSGNIWKKPLVGLGVMGMKQQSHIAGGGIVDGVGDEGDGPGALAGEFDEDDALEAGAAAALAEDGDDLFGGAVDAFDEGEVFDEVFDLGEDLAADEEGAQEAEDVDDEPAR